MKRSYLAVAIVAACLMVLVVLATPALGGRSDGRNAPGLDNLILGSQIDGQLTPAAHSQFVATPEQENPSAAPSDPPPTATATAPPPTATSTATPLPTLTPTPSPTPTLAPINPSASAAPPTWNGLSIPIVSAAAAIVVDEASGEVLYGKEAHVRLAPASLTKIATAIVALEQGDLDQWVDIEVDSREMIGSSLMGLLPGDRFKLNHLLYGLMLPSGNDAALAIAQAVSGSVPAFIDEMNALATELGLHNTHFENPHGLDGSEHYMSAYDLAMMSRYAMAMDSFWPYSSTKWVNVWGNRQMLLKNLNPVLYLYPGGDGMKTGFTDNAGKTLVGSATRDGNRVFVVLLNAPEREGDALLLLDWAFDGHTWP